jgi:hypothetical protein
MPFAFRFHVKQAATLALSALVVAGSTWSGDAVAQKRHRPLCARLRCKTVLDSAHVRLATVTVSDAYGEPYLEHVAVWKPSGRTTPLGDNGGSGFDCTCLGRFALAGRFLGYVTVGFSHEEPSTVGYGVARLNVQTGHREDVSVDFDGTATNKGCVGEAFASGASGVTAIVATAAGTVAWIMAAPFPPRLSGSVVCEISPGADVPSVLAESKEIVPDSLALAPGRLYWMEGAVARSATIR